ncbi:GntR family transcriptional regulator [Arhodomonas aquaeolei]|uniref:GntR family transcriptional regulator n=1 Tax=Arhodomonas aquaeolei TaxID=2369 RepID=UPI00036EE795|nr:GntR family transcriptional regulator [Arhodomonas aquaeolei]
MAQQREPRPLEQAGLETPGRGRRASDDAIYDAIYEAVLTQRLPPGTRLPEITLGELFGVSRSVVRKALSRLTADQIITRRPNQMALVAHPSVEETRQIFDARRLVEGEVARQLAGRLSGDARERLEHIIRDEHAAHTGDRQEDRVHHSMAFHLCLADNAPNEVLGRMLRELVIRTSIVIALYKAPGMSACYLGDDHQELVRCLAEGRGDEAATLVRQHLSTLESRLALSDEERPVDLAEILRR